MLFSFFRSKPRVFISHSNRDNAFVERLVEDLQQAGARVWVDFRELHYGDFVQVINSALDECEFIVPVLTPEACDSEWVQMEVNAGIDLTANGEIRAVIPVIAKTCPKVPALWRTLNRFDATKNYDAALEGLLKAVGLPPLPTKTVPQIAGAFDPAIPGSAAIEWDARPRQLPLYLLVETSEQTRGSITDSLNSGVQLLCSELKNDPRSASTVSMSVIAFGDRALRSELVPIEQFQPFKFSAGGGAALGSALHALRVSLNWDVDRGSQKRKGDYRAIAFLLSTGKPSDQWRPEAKKLQAYRQSGRCTVIGLLMGHGNRTVMEQVCDEVLDMSSTTAVDLSRHLQWVTGPLRY